MGIVEKQLKLLKEVPSDVQHFEFDIDTVALLLLFELVVIIDQFN